MSVPASTKIAEQGCDQVEMHSSAEHSDEKDVERVLQ
jgi:hypothetical protein